MHPMDTNGIKALHLWLSLMQIADITLNDLEELKELQPDGWADITPHYRFYIMSPFCHPIKVMLNGKITGIGAVILHQSTAWLGHIIVHQEFRHRGIGTAVTRKLCRRLLDRHFQTISLIATVPGEPLYRKIGFKKETEYHFFKNENSEVPLSDPANMQSGLDYMEEILYIDRLTSGEDRLSLLKDHLPDAQVYLRGNKVLGFFMPTLHEGIVPSTDKLAGIELLKLRLQNKSVCIIPRENEAAASFLTDNDFSLYQKGARMSLGRKIAFAPEMLFNRVGGNLG